MSFESVSVKSEPEELNEEAFHHKIDFEIDNKIQYLKEEGSENVRSIKKETVDVYPVGSHEVEVEYESKKVASSNAEIATDMQESAHKASHKLFGHYTSLPSHLRTRNAEQNTPETKQCKGMPKVYAVKKPYTCKICGKQFAHTNRLIPHMRLHGPVNDSTEILTAESRNSCQKQFSNPPDLGKHKRMQGAKPFKCQFCSKQFSDYCNLVRHQRTHTGELPFKCQVCMRQFTDYCYLVQHERIHTGERPFKCQICAKQFPNNFNLNRHARTHTEEKLYECQVCKELFSNQSSLDHHERIHRSHQKPFKCQVCLKEFSNHSNLVTHERIHTGEESQNIFNSV